MLEAKVHGGDDGVVPLPSTLQEQLCPGHVPAKGSGKYLGMPGLSVVGRGLGTRSPTKGEGHKEHSSGQCKARGLSPKQTLPAQVNFQPGGERRWFPQRLDSGTEGSVAEAAASPSPVWLFYFPHGGQ